MAAKAELTVAAIVVNIQGSAKSMRRWNALISADAMLRLWDAARWVSRRVDE
jgi:hypothetical protein